MNFQVELKGLQELNRKLEGRIRRLEQKGLRESLLEFGEPIRAAGERNARTTISPRIKYAMTTRMRGSSGTIRIGPSNESFEPGIVGPMPRGKSTAWVTHAMISYWFEFGYNIRHTPKGPSLAHVGARPTLTPAYKAQKQPALDAFETKIFGFLEEEVP